MKTMKKIVALVLAILMTVTLVPSYILQTDAAKKTIRVKTIEMNKSSVSVAAGNQIKLKATLSPANTTQKTLKWSSDKKKIATVSKDGTVTAVKPGKATITVKVKGTSKKATCKITVTKAVKVKKITLNKTSLSMQAGSKMTLKASLTPKNTTQRTITYKSSAPSVVKVSKQGVVTAVKKGSATITATVKGTSKKAVCKVTVTAKKKVSVTAVKFAKKKMTLKQGETVQATVTVSPSNATNKAVTYTSSNKNVATVDANGKIQAKEVGQTVITATAKDGSKKKASMTVVVEYVQSRFVITYDASTDAHPIIFGTKEDGTMFTLYESAYLSYNSKKVIGSKKEVQGDKVQLTFTIESPLPQTCYLGVQFYYSNIGEDALSDISDRGVQAEAWQGDKKVATYTAPHKKGNEWIAAAFESTTGKFTEISKVGTSDGVTDFYREFYYGDLAVTAMKTNSYITRANITGTSIALVTPSDDFKDNIKNYLDQIVPVIKGMGYKYAVDYDKDYGCVLTLTDSSGKVRKYDVFAMKAEYDELRILEVTSGNGSLQNYTIIESWEVVRLYLTTRYPADADLQFKTSDAASSIVAHYDRNFVELTGKNGVTKFYYLECVPDYDTIYGDLKVTDVTSTDAAFTRATIDESYIEIWGTAESLTEIMDQLQFKTAMLGTTWEYQTDSDVIEEDGVERQLVLKSPGGISRTYTLYYCKDYNKIYDGLELTDITSKDGSVLLCEVYDTSVHLYLSEELEEIEDQIQITATKTGVTWELSHDEEENEWTLTLRDPSGMVRSYDVWQSIDYDIRYGSLKVTEITSAKMKITSYYVGDENIILRGMAESLQVQDLTFKTGQKGVEIEWDETEYENVWTLTLTDADDRTRCYDLYYYLDTDAVYGDLKVTDITAKDPDLITYLFIDSDDINLGLKADTFAGIKDTLKVELADADATWEWLYDDSDYSYQLKLTRKDGTTRIYDVYWYMDYEAIYGTLGISEVICDDDRVTEIYVDSTTIILTATDGTLEDVMDQIDVTISDETATWRIAFEEDTYEWKVILTGTDGTERRYSIWYFVDTGEES